MHEGTAAAVSLRPTCSISGNVRFVCLRTLKPIMKAQWTVLPIPQVLVNFINKLREAGEKDKHIGQDPIISRGVPNAVEIVKCGDEQLSTLGDMEETDKTSTGVRVYQTYVRLNMRVTSQKLAGRRSHLYMYLSQWYQ